MIFKEIYIFNKMSLTTQKNNSSKASKASSKNIKIDYDSIPISTQTIIGKTNWRINNEELFNALPITRYSVVTKKRGRRPKNEAKLESQSLDNGNIITLKLGDKLRGVSLKNKKKKDGDMAKKYFRNSLTMVMQTDGKLLNAKISQNGMIQATGAKSYDNIQTCVETINNYIGANNKVLNVVCNSNLAATFIPVMVNINFNLGFCVNREKLDEYINNETPYYSLLENSFGYAGVNIKMPLSPEKMDLIDVRQIVYKNKTWETKEITYKDYISQLGDKEKEKEEAKIRYITYLCFQSGSVIMSSPHKECMREGYEEFMSIINKCRDIIEDK
jgi:hypothetical protein